METLGKRLKNRRLELGLSQEELSNILNINRVTYQGYESDRHKPDVDTLAKLANILIVSADFLLDTWIVKPMEIGDKAGLFVLDKIEKKRNKKKDNKE